MTPKNSPPVYLVVSHQPLVGHDIAEAVRDEIAGARVIVGRSVAEVLTLLTDVEQIDVAFIEASAAMFAATSLPGVLMLAGTRIVLVGPEQTPQCETLPIPFGLDDLTRIIRQKTPCPASEQGAIS